MARIRSLKPEFPQSESMGNVSRDARLTFVLLWTLADDEGRLRGNSRMLASLLFPYDDDAPGLIDSWLLELEHEGCIVRYKADGSSYVQVCNWLIHQKIDKPSKSKIPAFDESSRILANPRESSSLDQGSKDQRIKDQGREESSSLRSEGAESAVEKSGLPAANENDDSLLSAIFEVGLPAMLAGGCSEKSARSLLGRLRKELGDLEALVAVEAMRREQPLDAAAWASAAIKARESTAVSLDAFMAGCRERGESVVSGYAPIFDYAEQAGIPEEFIRLAWDEFKRRHMPGGIWASTRREDWRLSFLAALQTNAMRLWYADSKGALLLTAAGLQADAAGRAAA